MIEEHVTHAGIRTECIATAARPRLLRASICMFAVLGFTAMLPVSAQNCPDRIRPGSSEDIEVRDPTFINSVEGKLHADLIARYDAANAYSNERFCLVYRDENGKEIESPVLRVRADDEVNLHLVNELRDVPAEQEASPEEHADHVHSDRWGIDKPCTPSPMINDGTTNLHFHGLNISPTCSVNGPWADEVISALIQPESNQDYQFRIPWNDPPGLFWYHPHVHSLSQRQVLGGMTGALIVDGIESMHNAVTGLRERVLVLRDQERQTPPTDLRYVDRPDLLPGGSEAGIVDDHGDKASGRLLHGESVKTRDDKGNSIRTVMPPWKDVSINGAPVVFQLNAAGAPAYSKAPIIKMTARKEFWRVANAAADTYFRLQLVLDNKPQALHLVAMDGIPISSPSGQALLARMHGGKRLRASDGGRLHRTIALTEILLPPGGRAEFIVAGPARGQHAEFVSRFYDTNADYDAGRVLAEVRPDYVRSIPRTKQRGPVAAYYKKRLRFVEDSDKIQRREALDHTLIFHQDDAKFYIEEKDANGRLANQAFTMTEGPRITVRQGEIQEWKIENQAEEAHAFHIHQIHFRVMQRWPDMQTLAEKELDQVALRDVIELPAWDKDKDPDHPPYVILRMYFNEADIAGNLLYHCHILEHEDEGMMAIIKIEAPTLGTR
jgi:FtsP/CotA-like multicopper oxidase with cupredoxin domain